MHALHIHDHIEADGATALTRLITALGPAWRHTITAASPLAPEVLQRIEAIGGGADLADLTGAPSLARLRRIAGALGGFDLILTYGYGVIDAAMAHTLFAQTLRLPPLVHHEGRADPQRSRRRDWYRRLALGRAAAVIVPTERLRTIALGDWQQPQARVHLIRPGADIAATARTPRADALPRLIKRKGERWLGVIADAYNPAPLDTLARLPEAWQLVWFGDGPLRTAVRAAAIERSVGHRVHPLDLAMATPALGLLDLIAFTADDPPLDLVVAAMATGLAVAAPPGDVMAELLCEQNAAQLGAAAIEPLVADAVLRTTLGTANRASAQGRFDYRDVMAARAAIYRRAAERGRPA